MDLEMHDDPRATSDSNPETQPRRLAVTGGDPMATYLMLSMKR